MADTVKAADDSLDLECTHPFYDKVYPVRKRALDLYVGGDVVEEAGEAYLYRLSNEDQDLYDFRLKRAVFDNWVEPIVTARQAVLWRKSPDRSSLPTQVAGFVEDVDCNGTAADTFFERVTEAAQAGGMYWVLIDAPRAPFEVDEEGNILVDGEGEPIVKEVSSQQEAEEQGVRPSMFAIHPDNVLDWEYGPDNRLNYAVIKYAESKSAGPGRGRETQERWVVWTRINWTIFAIEDNNSDSGEVVRYKQLNTGNHNIGDVPLVPFYGTYVSPGLGYPVTRSVLKHNLSIYNKFSDRDMAEHITNNPIPVHIGYEDVQGFNVNWGTGMFVKIPQGATVPPEVFYLEAKASGITASRESEKDLIRRIVETALWQAKRDTAQVESHETLKAQRETFNSSMHSVAVMSEASENLCWVYMARFAGMSVVESNNIGVEYNKDFTDKAIADGFVVALSNLVEAKQLSRETFWQMLKRGEILASDFDSDAERNRIAQETDLDVPAPASITGVKDDPPTEDEPPANEPPTGE